MLGGRLDFRSIFVKCLEEKHFSTSQKHEGETSERQTILGQRMVGYWVYQLVIIFIQGFKFDQRDLSPSRSGTQELGMFCKKVAVGAQFL